MPSPFLLRVNSRPTNCDDKTWEKWYTEEHVPDLINYNASTRAAFYREIFDAGEHLYSYNEVVPHPRQYMAFYQSDFREPLKSEEYKGIRTTSELFPKSKEIHDNGEFDARNYELIQDFDPNSLGDTPAPYILYAELEPENEEDLDIFYREEHFPLLAKVPGYRRGLRYRLGPATSLTEGEPPKFVALHEFDKKHGINSSEEMKIVTTTPWTLKTMKGVKFAEIRSFELIKAFGY